MIKAVLFDLDNTLIDFMKMKNLCCESAVSAMIRAGLKLPRQKALKLLMETYWEVGIEYQHIFQEFLRRVEGKIDYKILASAIIAYRKTQAKHLYPYPKVRPTLSTLQKRGYKLAIVSDAPRIQGWTRLVSMGLENYFDAVVCFEDTGERKPSKKPFQKALGALNLKPEECVMIGDFVDRDILGAKRLGIKSVFARYGSIHKPKSDADYEIDRIEDILSILKE